MAAASLLRMFMHSVLLGGFVMWNLFLSPCNANVEVDALIAVKNMLYDPQNVLKSWDPSLIDPCTWLHINCDTNQRVITINLQLKMLSGSLSPRISDLPNLQYLNIWSNSISENLPTNLGNLKNIIAFRLSDNKFTGQIPTSLGQLSNLHILDLSNNKLSGIIPISLGQLSNLNVLLDLSNNQLSGPVPTGGVFSKFRNDSFKGNPGLCGRVVRKECPPKMI